MDFLVLAHLMHNYTFKRCAIYTYKPGDRFAIIIQNIETFTLSQKLQRNRTIYRCTYPKLFSWMAFQ